MRKAALTAFVAWTALATSAAHGQATPGCQIGVFADSAFALDVDGDGAWSAGDRVVPIDVAGGAGAPLVGDWNGDGVDDLGKQVGTWYRVDLDGDGVWEGNAGGDRNASFAPSFGSGAPLVGDWDGDGRDEIGTYVAGTGTFLLDANGNGLWDGAAGGDVASSFASFAGPGLPVVGDWNGDGDDDLALAFRGWHVFVDGDDDERWDGVAGGDRIVVLGMSRPFYAMDPGVVLAGDWDLDGADELVRLHLTGGLGHQWFEIEGLGFVQLWMAFGQGHPLLCDWDGDGTANLGKLIGEVFYLDANGNGFWDGNAGGDLSMGFVPPGGIGAPVAGRWSASPP